MALLDTVIAKQRKLTLAGEERAFSVTAQDRYQAGELFWEFQDASVIQYENAAFVGHESTASELKATPRTISGTATLRPLTLTAEKYNG